MVCLTRPIVTFLCLFAIQSLLETGVGARLDAFGGLSKSKQDLPQSEKICQQVRLKKILPGKIFYWILELDCLLSTSRATSSFSSQSRGVGRSPFI